MQDYVKAVRANKITLAGYVLMAGAATTAALGVTDAIEWSPQLTGVVSYGGVVGFWLNLMTDFGRGTLYAYRRAKDKIATHGTLHPQYVEKLPFYCARQGTRLAAREAGLEHLL